MLLRGARQVGKSTLVRLFCKGKKLKLWEMNLERHARVHKAFESMDPEHIVREIGFVLGESISPSDGIIFLDEIQACPSAVTALSYFYEERPDWRVMAAGSLLEFALGGKGLSMPVGRIETLYIGPMTFQEFLTAVGREDLVSLLLDPQKDQPSPMAHEALHMRIPLKKATCSGK